MGSRRRANRMGMSGGDRSRTIVEIGGDGRSGRDVAVGMVPRGENAIEYGVVLQGAINGKDRKRTNVMVPPDEARFHARDEEDAGIKAKLLDTAKAVEELVAEQISKFPDGMILVAPPVLSGANALRAWVMLYRERWQAAYAHSQSVNEGYQSDVIVIASPQTESLDDPPVGFDLQPRNLYRREVTKLVPSLINPFASPAPEGYFHCFATRADGRFKGSFEGLLRVS